MPARRSRSGPSHRNSACEPLAVPVAASFPRAHPVYQRIYVIVRSIPRGRVATYGQVAELAGSPGRARQAGYALHALPMDARVPWQRVVNAQGRISARSDPGQADHQRALLEYEGVRFDRRSRIDLDAFGWRPRVSCRRFGAECDRPGTGLLHLPVEP
ncbi:MAG: MGMT family protein [Planctomycetes bacterium]|nr:MGMT family protein [Planctomycetota bacterium]